MKKRLIVIVILALIFLAAICIYFFNNYNPNLVDINDVKTDPGYIDITYDSYDNILDEDILGILTIDKIGLKASIKEGSDNKTLKDYIGHIDGTSLYDGNVGLAAHNRGNKYSYFARINELENGDIITYQTKFYNRTYKVNNMQVIFETDWSLLEDTIENKITLITCIANKKNQRLCVQATEITENDL